MEKIIHHPNALLYDDVMGRKVVNIDRIVTKSGDAGRSFASCGMLHKSDQWFDLIGCLDELNSVLGIAKLHLDCGPDCNCEGDASRCSCDLCAKCLITHIQGVLFNIGADIYTNKLEKFNKCEINSLEIHIELFHKKENEFDSFLIPTGKASYMHFARSVARRTERAFWQMADNNAKLNKDMGIYLNRLSDLLFVLAIIGDDKKLLWKPGSARMDVDESENCE